MTYLRNWNGVPKKVGIGNWVILVIFKEKLKQKVVPLL